MQGANDPVAAGFGCGLGVGVAGVAVGLLVVLPGSGVDSGAGVRLEVCAASGRPSSRHSTLVRVCSLSATLGSQSWLNLCIPSLHNGMKTWS